MSSIRLLLLNALVADAVAVSADEVVVVVVVAIVNAIIVLVFYFQFAVKLSHQIICFISLAQTFSRYFWVNFFRGQLLILIHIPHCLFFTSC